MRGSLLVFSLAFVIGGCPAPGRVGSTAPPRAMAAESKSALTYTAVRNGLPTGKMWKSHLAVGDINGDGFPDIGAVSRLADGPYVWKNDGRGNWTDASSGLPREPFCGGGMDFGDVNRDGKIDVAIADHCKGAFVFLGDGAGRWSKASAGLPTIGCEDIAIGDFNHDGCLDLALVAATEEGVRAFTGNCRGTWKESATGLPQTEWGNEVVLADINGDGNLDIAAAYAAGPRVWLGNGRGEWSEASEGLPAPEIHGLYWGLAVGDVNGDGKLDLAAADQTRGVDVFIQDPGPPKDSPIHLQAKFLPGFKQSVAEERVTLIATRSKEDIIPLGFQEGALKVYDAHSTGMISDLVKRLNQLEPTDWTQVTATYVLRK